MTQKNYCNNCNEYKKSWADKLGSHHSDSRCWGCNKYTLDKSKVQVVRTLEETMKTTTSHSLYDDGTCGTKTTYCDNDGISTTIYFRERKRTEYKSQISSYRDNVIICTKPLQTASNVEYKKPGPCRIM